jgi:predicted helicase
VYYTPEPVVSYIVRSVDYLLRTRFNLSGGLADQATATYSTLDQHGNPVTHTGPRVLILDPACGTGTFLYAVLELIRSEFMKQNNAGKWSGFVREQLLPRLFGFELLMAPYAVAHLKLGMQLAGQDLPEVQRSDWAYDFGSGERLGVYLTNTLEEALKKSQLLMGQYISEEANAAVEIKKDRPIMVVLGNPPYANFGMLNKGKWIQDLLEDYKKGLNEKKLNLDDDFIKFIRFGQWRIQQTGSGILAFITSHTYLDGITHRQMRRSLLETFTDIYILDLHGGSRKGEQAPDGGPDENVFDIQQGVAIGIFVKELGKSGSATVHHTDLWGVREGKYEALLSSDLTSSNWGEIFPKDPSFFFVPWSWDAEEEYKAGRRLSQLFPLNQNAIKTDRDELFLDFERGALEARINSFYSPVALSPQFRAKYRVEDSSSYDLLTRRSKTKFDASNAHLSLYRPFDVRWLYYDPSLTSRPAWDVMQHMVNGQNHALVTTRQTKDVWGVLATAGLSGHKSVAAYDINSLFPLYLYPVVPEKSDDTKTEVPSAPKGKGSQLTMGNVSPWPEGTDGRRPNLSPDVVKDLEQRIGLTFVSDGPGDLTKTFGPEDVFHYIYAVLHSPTYRQRYAEFLKIDFPRIPLTTDAGLFRELVGKGADLTAFHLMESPALIQPITSYPVTGDNLVEPGHPRYLAPGELEPGTGKPLEKGRVYISKDDAKTGKRGQYVEGVPKDVWEFQVGGYQVCDKWLKDRRGRVLTNADITHYEKVVVALKETIRLMAEVDQVIEEHGGWPLRGNG